MHLHPHGLHARELAPTTCIHATCAAQWRCNVKQKHTHTNINTYVQLQYMRHLYICMYVGKKKKKQLRSRWVSQWQQAHTATRCLYCFKPPQRSLVSATLTFQPFLTYSPTHRLAAWLPDCRGTHQFMYCCKDMRVSCCIFCHQHI